MDSLSTVDKAIDLLFHLHGCGQPEGVTAVGRALGLPKTSAHRLLSTLARRGLLERDPGGRYRPGLGLVALGLGALEREPVVALARPLLEREAAALGETVFLTAPRGGAIVVLDKAEGTGFLRAAPRIGSSVPAHATAVGKLTLAFCPDSLEASDRGAAPEAFTSDTLVDEVALAREVERARLQGWAENQGEWIPGLSVVAAPVFQHERMLAAIAAAAPSARMETLGSEAVARRLLAAAKKVGDGLSGRLRPASEAGGESA